jgi:DNA-binding response OmpR family regulator
MSPRQILIVTKGPPPDDVRGELEARGFGVAVAEDFESAYRELQESDFELVIVELAENRDGIDFIKRVRLTQELAGLLILVVADWGTGAATLALSQGADGYDPRPFEKTRVVASVERLFSLRTVMVK